MNIFITEKVCLEPAFLNKNIKKNIYNKLVETLLNKCKQEYGYVLHISEKIEIISNESSISTNTVFFNVKVKITVFKPKAGEEMKCKIIKMDEKYILAECEKIDKIKVFIPTNNITNYKYNKLENNFVINKNKKIEVNEIITTKIEKVKYENKNFSCIGSLKL